MSVTSQSRQRLRQTMQSLEMADEILDLLEAAAANSQNFAQSFLVGDWISSDSGDTYSLTVVHNLNTLRPEISVYDSSAPAQKVDLHSVLIVNSNTVTIKVSQQSSDARFAGQIVVDV